MKFVDCSNKHAPNNFQYALCMELTAADTKYISINKFNVDLSDELRKFLISTFGYSDMLINNNMNNTNNKKWAYTLYFDFLSATPYHLNMNSIAPKITLNIYFMTKDDAMKFKLIWC